MINWYIRTFQELSPFELYAIIRLRNEVFVVEQNCVYQDADDNDQHSLHFMGWEEKNLLAYTRIIPRGISFDEVSIGRVVCSPSARKKGIGRELMEKSLEQVSLLFGDVTIRIGAQLYLQKFYSSLGFEKASDVYLEDGIEHIEMLRTGSIS
jgi:ElaA protein